MTNLTLTAAGGASMSGATSVVGALTFSDVLVPSGVTQLCVTVTGTLANDLGRSCIEVAVP